MNIIVIVFTGLVTAINITGNSLTLIAIKVGGLVRKSFLFIAYLAVCDILLGGSFLLRNVLYSSINLQGCRILLCVGNSIGLMTSAGMLMLVIELCITFKNVKRQNLMKLHRKKYYGSVIFIVLFSVTSNVLVVSLGEGRIAEENEGKLGNDFCMINNPVVLNQMGAMLLHVLLVVMYVATVALLAVLFHLAKALNQPPRHEMTAIFTVVKNATSTENGESNVTDCESNMTAGMYKHLLSIAAVFLF